ncbi:sugar phosphate isomerase/epimerase family protein [Flexithrix dorotheae]|uniref:sugar phosphate isomerase/epimerase family protein n=1 Tax=Flexithrix dorotheae TaxID=70993 RepID=UPI0003773ED2|nr:sugar phosphate isomerase/epimerase family protein [Flexithrix dorotheae]
MKKNRRTFIKNVGQYSAGIALFSQGAILLNSCGKSTQGEEGGEEVAKEETVVKEAAPGLFFEISLAQWSLHKAFFAGELDNLDFAAKAKNDFGISAVEYVNQFFKDKGKDKAYLGEMKKRAADNGVKSVLIMVDGEGNLGSTDEAERVKAVENHYKWVEAAQFLGCHSIRVNAAGQGTAEEVASAAVDGLGKLSTFAKDYGIGVIVENHGGYSSNGEWLSGVIKNVGLDNCGTLPDFGNFCIERSKPESNTPEGWANTVCLEDYDRYKGVKELMPYAKGVSAKSHDFDAEGNETHTDFLQMLQLVKDAGYKGYIGVEYEGRTLSEDEGILATKKLLTKAGAQLS